MHLGLVISQPCERERERESWVTQVGPILLLESFKAETFLDRVKREVNIEVLQRCYDADSEDGGRQQQFK